ncbi:MAG: sugar phosphate isomerase/epimerase family protein [Planctomycetota bacterium]|nr:sugar phosphate isomerase/epimerase family protein [Planctomycetota bacterium]
MQLGFASAIIPDLSLDEVLTTAHEIGYDCVELMCWPLGKAERRYAGVTHVDVDQLDQGSATEIRQCFDQAGVSISGLGYYPNPLSPDLAESNTAVEHICKVIDACTLLGIPQMNTFIGRDPGRSIRDNWPRMLDTWKPIVQFAEQKNVRIGIENCPMLFSDDEWPGGKNLAISPEVWRRMFEDIPSDHFGLNYDPSHMIWQQMDPFQPMLDFREKLFHVHAKDVRIERDQLDQVGILATPLKYHTPKLPGKGDIDWRQFFSVLDESGYDGPVCVEVEDRDYEETAELRITSLEESHRYLRQFIPRD